MKILKWVGLAVLLPIFYFGWKIVYPPAYFPHTRIVIRVPYSPADLPTNMIPMGETIYHPKPQVPNGHPGIDFGWDSGASHEVLASSGGRVTGIVQGASEPGKWDVEVQSGVYYLRYKEMDDYNRSFKVGSSVQSGELIGQVGRYCDIPGSKGRCHFNLHWELASVSNIQDRWCPVTYLDSASRQSLEAVWATVPSTDKVKSKFPAICDGDYKDKAEAL